MSCAVQRLAVLILMVSLGSTASAGRALAQDEPTTAVVTSSTGAKTIVNKLRMITREQSDQAAATIVAAAAASKDSVSISSAAMTSQQDQVAVDAHNKYRAWHQVGPLTWSDTVAAAAMDYASKCIWQHDPDNNAYGENLYATMDKDGDLAAFLQEAVDGWYAEVSKCNFAKPESCFNSGAGHFTQLVWKGSTELGCAAVKCNTLQNLPSWTDGGTIVVCRYNPPGNYWGAFTDNIFPRNDSNVGTNPPIPSPKPPTNPSPPPGPDPPGNPQPPPAPPPPVGTPKNFQLGAVLQAGWYMSVESANCMSSNNKKYKVCVSRPGNVTVVQVRPHKVLWASNTKIRRAADLPARLWLDDNNVLSVVGKSLSNSVFSSPACSWCSRSKSVLIMQDDGNLVLYGSSVVISSRFAVRVDGRILWQTGLPAGSRRN